MNERSGSKRRPPSTIATPDTLAALESPRQTRALRGPKRLTTAMHSSVRDAWAGPVQILKPANAPKGTRRRRHRDPDPSRFTMNLGGSTPCGYVWGKG